MNQPIEKYLKLNQTQNIAATMAGEALIMMVDDEELVIQLIQAFLGEAGYTRFTYTEESPKALELIERDRPQLLLLDINMPRMNGFEILEAMRAEPRLQHIPVIVLTSADDAETKLKALSLGATDFLRKPVDRSELVLRVRNTLAAKAYQDYLAYYDRATGLANRQRFMSEVERALREAQKRGATSALLGIDLDRLKQVNEALGPALGDQIIRQAGARVRGVLSSLDTATYGEPFAARSGGDEFSVVLPAVAGAEAAAQVVQSLLQALAVPYNVDGKELHVTASLGVALFPADGSVMDELVKNANAALHQAKQAGRNTYRFYSKAFNDKAAQRLSMEGQLRRALENGEFELFYQPKFRVADASLCGGEALLRWRHPQTGLVPPNEFIPVAEECGLITAIGNWALHAACAQLRAWQEAGLRRVPIAVNVSPRQFQRDLIETVRQAIATSAQGDYLRLELTESSVMADRRGAIELLHELKALGMKISVDDFGTGYSSLSHLETLPLDEVKIDRSFISRIDSEQAQAPLVDMIIAMAHSLSFCVVAEGVETPAQLAYLRTRACDECQGFHFSKPLPAQEFAARYLE